jgi:hypothetical protein
MLSGIALEVVFTAILFRSRVHRILPVFATYMVSGLISDSGALLTLMHTGGPGSALYFRMFQIEMPLDSLIQFGVFVELAWSALRPFKSLRPLRAIVGLTILTAILGVGLWPLAGMLPIAHFPPSFRALYHLSYTISILRVAVCFLLAGCSQILAINWRHRELQVATGLGFYSLISLGATLIHSHQSSAAAYHLVDELTSVSYFVSLIYWSSAFLKSEAPRREFSPEMQRVLLQVARAGRMALESAR